MREVALKHERLIADCMKQRGFDYAVAIPRDVFIEEALRKATVEGEDVEKAIEEASRRTAQQIDPNDRILTAMSPAKAQGWDNALYGTDSATGCSDQTFTAAWGTDLDADVEEANRVIAEVERRPEILSAQQDYISCMKPRGYNVVTLEDALNQAWARAEGLDSSAAAVVVDSAKQSHDTCVAPTNRYSIGSSSN